MVYGDDGVIRTLVDHVEYELARMRREKGLPPYVRAQTPRAAATEARLAAHADVLPDLLQLRNGGMTLTEIASTMNDCGRFQHNGKPWSAMQVSRVLKTQKVAA